MVTRGADVIGNLPTPVAALVQAGLPETKPRNLLAAASPNSELVREEDLRLAKFG